MPPLYLVIPEHVDDEGIVRSIVLYGADDQPDHFRAALTPAQAEPLAAMQRLLAEGWEAHAMPHAQTEFNEVSEITFLGVDVVRDGIRLSLLRGFPLGAEATGRDLLAIVREAIAVMPELLEAERRGERAGD